VRLGLGGPPGPFRFGWARRVASDEPDRGPESPAVNRGEDIGAQLGPMANRPVVANGM
jgi:hypothetical protein